MWDSALAEMPPTHLRILGPPAHKGLPSSELVSTEAPGRIPFIYGELPRLLVAASSSPPQSSEPAAFCGPSTWVPCGRHPLPGTLEPLWGPGFGGETSPNLSRNHPPIP